jgi:hypothetical protein
VLGENVTFILKPLGERQTKYIAGIRKDQCQVRRKVKSPLQPLFEANKALLVALVKLNQVRKIGIVQVSVCDKGKL